MEKLAYTNIKEKQIAEALERMKIMKLYSPVLRDWKKNNLVYYSENSPLGGILYWAYQEERYMKVIKEFEEKTGYVVYHATHEYTDFGEILDLFYVSSFEEEWENEKKSISQGFAYVKAINLSVDEFSDYGTIQFQNRMGGLVRIA